MKQYELMVIVDPDLGTDAINAKLEDVRKLLASHKGEIFFEDLWGMRDLAYKIRKRDKGFYAVFDANMEGSELKELNRTLMIDNEILRHLVVSLPENYKPVSLAEREKEAEMAAKEAEIAEVVDKKKKPAARTAKKTEKPAEKVEEKTAEPVKEEPAEVAAETEEKEEKKAEKAKSTLEDVDKKLSNLLDNPDLNF